MVYARHPGFIGRHLLKPEKAGETYRMLVFHESKATFMAMHTSPDWVSVIPAIAEARKVLTAPRPGDTTRCEPP